MSCCQYVSNDLSFLFSVFLLARDKGDIYDMWITTELFDISVT